MFLLDTNILLAAADLSTPEHSDCVSLIDGRDDLAVPAPVAVETAWMIESRLGPDAEAAFVDSIVSREVEVDDLADQDWRRCRDLIAQYAVYGSGSLTHRSSPLPSGLAFTRSRP